MSETITDEFARREKGETNSDRYNCYVVENPKKGCVSGNGKEIGSKTECEYLKDLFAFFIFFF